MNTCNIVLTVFLLVIGSTILFMPAAATSATSDLAGNQPLVRGHQFAITITGIPNTGYYTWLTHTWSLSGALGDQPPVIVDYQANVQKDPSGGPYTIGSYAFNNGNGQTILDDVTPSSASMSNTNYYALVTTDSTGRAVVAFQTSINTAERSFSVKVENPTSVNNDSLLVQYGSPSVSRGSVSTDSITTRPTKKITVPTPTPTPVPSTPTDTPIPVTSSPVPTTTPTPRIPLDSAVAVFAVAAGLLVVRES
ncbi:MAG: hypothetical protein ABFC71_02890 [Methanoregula sp.]